MTLVDARPIRFSPAGLSDTLDETDAFPGAMAVLQNLIPDPTTKNLWTCRPAAISVTVFGSFTTPGYISVFKVIGSLVYGLIASGRNAGKDEPFCYNLLTNAFVTVLGITAANSPTSPATTGDWTPPTMALCGVNLVVTHPGFTGGNFFGWFDISNPAAPIWHADNLLGTGSIEALGAITGGTLYTAGTYLDVALTISSGTAGTGATADITVAGGAVTAVSLRKYGTGYDNTSVLTAPAASIGGTGTGFTVPVTVVAAGKILFTTVPSWVFQFYGRAYFGVNPTIGQPSAVFTDSLVLTATNANQALTFGDNLPLIACGGLPLLNQLGGIIQSIFIFKVSQIVQITGDPAFNNLATNVLQTSSGTLSPRSLVSAPEGLFFIDHDGLRMVDFNAKVHDPIGVGGQGVNLPFLNPIAPSRIAGATNGSILRLSVQNSNVGNTPHQEYWYDLTRKIWSGPHTFPADCIDTYGSVFIVAPTGVVANLFNSPYIPTPTTGSVENGAQLTFAWQTAMIADNQAMAMSEIAEMQIKTSAIPGTPVLTVTSQDENGNVLNSFSYNYAAVASLWGTLVWGVGLWGGTQGALYPRRIDFPTPTVFNRLAIRATGACSQGFQIGDMFIRRRELGYLQVVP